MPEARRISRRQRGGEFPGLLAEQHRELRPSEQEEDQENEHAARGPLRIQEPIRLGDGPKPTAQSTAEVLRTALSFRNHQDFLAGTGRG